MGDNLEVIKTGVRAAVESALRPFAKLIEKVFGGAAEQLGGMLTDELAARRFTRQVKIFKRLEATIADAGFEPQKIPDNIWVPILQEATLQDEESLQEMWANLLSNAADPRQDNPVSPSFAQILREFTSREAKFLDSLYKKRLNDPHRRVPINSALRPDFTFTRNDLLIGYVEAGLSRCPRLIGLTVGDYREGGDELRSDLSDFATTMDILARNGILKESVTPNAIDLSSIATHIKKNQLPRSLEATVTTRYYLTDLGIQFIKACQAPSPDGPSDEIRSQ